MLQFADDRGTMRHIYNIRDELNQLRRSCSCKGTHAREQPVIIQSNQCTICKRLIGVSSNDNCSSVFRSSNSHIFTHAYKNQPSMMRWLNWFVHLMQSFEQFVTLNAHIGALALILIYVEQIYWLIIRLIIIRLSARDVRDMSITNCHYWMNCNDTWEYKVLTLILQRSVDRKNIHMESTLASTLKSGIRFSPNVSAKKR